MPVKTGSELVQRCSAAQSKFNVDTQDKRSCLLAVTRPWKYCILNRKPLFPGRRPDPRDSSESTKPKLLTMRDLPLRWGRAATVGAGTNPPRQTEGPNTIRSAPGSRTGQAAPLCRQCTEAETASAYCSGAWYQSPLAAADPALGHSGQVASLGDVPLRACSQPTRVHVLHLPEICQQTT